MNAQGLDRERVREAWDVCDPAFPRVGLTTSLAEGCIQRLGVGHRIVNRYRQMGRRRACEEENSDSIAERGLPCFSCLRSCSGLT